jgi:uncharacterized lipoprotein YddW (UPF0748 family)
MAAVVSPRVRLFFALAWCALGAAIVVSTIAPLRAADSEVRALWVRRASIDSPDAIRKMVASASTAGFNTLFVQTEEGLASASAFDPVAETVMQAHAVGLRVHAWIDVARVSAPDELPTDRDHVIYQHPEWLMVPRAIAAELIALDSHNPDYLGRLERWTRLNSARVDGLYISPLQSDVAAHLAETVRGLVRKYALDGVYLDHVQYPGDDFDYSQRSIAAFRDFMRTQLPIADRQRIDATEAIDPFAYPNEFAEQWRLFRQSQLTALVARIRSTVKTERPASVVSAAVTSDATVAARDNFQDWRTWLENGFLDALCPMATAADAAAIAAQLTQVHALAGDKPVWLGIGANHLTQRETIDDIASARRAGVHGVILYSYDTLISPAKGLDFLSAIGRGAFAGS